MKHFKTLCSAKNANTFLDSVFVCSVCSCYSQISLMNVSISDGDRNTHTIPLRIILIFTGNSKLKTWCWGHAVVDLSLYQTFSSAAKPPVTGSEKNITHMSSNCRDFFLHAGFGSLTNFIRIKQGTGHWFGLCGLLQVNVKVWLMDIRFGKFSGTQISDVTMSPFSVFPCKPTNLRLEQQW